MSEAREAAKRRHPSCQSRVAHTDDRMQRLIDAAHDQEAMDVANRELAELEEWGMAPPSTMQRVNAKHHEVSTGGRGWLLDAIAPAAIVIFLFVFAVVASVTSDLGWWLA